MNARACENIAQLETIALGMIHSVRARPMPEGAGFDLGPNRAFYGEAATRLETFSRTLWAAAPLCAKGKLDAGWIVQGLATGTNPADEGYWGKLGDTDSRMVEMTAIAFALRIAPDEIWKPMDSEAKQHLVTWLSQINSCFIAKNNWLFFRVFVNESLRSLCEPYDEEKLNSDLQSIEALYIGDGWYGDGNIGTLDYYNAFAFHFYGLLYAHWNKDRDPERSELFRRRADQFAKSFIYWWDCDGSSIPFGRSLVYRFAMAAFWAAAAYAELPILEAGEIKGLWLRHLRWWFDQSIFDSDGVLNLGFAYPNHNMVEMYNAPGSPLWAFKAFLPLALPEKHAFWMAEELPMPDLEVKAVPLPDGKKVVGRGKTGHAWLLNAGQNIPWEGRAFSDKYARFAYSSRLGFSVSVEHTTPTAMAPDSSLIVSVDGCSWYGRGHTEKYRAGEDWVESWWSPCPGISIRTRLKVTPEGHQRTHVIQSEHVFTIMEGGFAIPRPDEALHQLEKNPAANFSMKAAPGIAEVRNGDYFSSIRDDDVRQGRLGEILQPWANTHLLFPGTVVPVLKGQFKSGTFRLQCSVVADRDNDH